MGIIWIIFGAVQTSCRLRTNSVLFFVRLQIIGRRREACRGRRGSFFGSAASTPPRRRRSVEVMMFHDSGAICAGSCLQRGQQRQLDCGGTRRGLTVGRELPLSGRGSGAGRSARRCAGAELASLGWVGPGSVRGCP
jgi:hypothetical protein